MALVGKRYVSLGGVELIVTRGGAGALADGDQPLVLKDGTSPTEPRGSGCAETVLQLGVRYRSRDGGVEVLVIRPGPCDLRCDGVPMEKMPRDGDGAGATVPRRPPPDGPLTSAGPYP